MRILRRARLLLCESMGGVHAQRAKRLLALRPTAKPVIGVEAVRDVRRDVRFRRACPIACAMLALRNRKQRIEV